MCFSLEPGHSPDHVPDPEPGCGISAALLAPKEAPCAGEEEGAGSEGRHRCHVIRASHPGKRNGNVFGKLESG